MLLVIEAEVVVIEGKLAGFDAGAGDGGGHALLINVVEAELAQGLEIAAPLPPGIGDIGGEGRLQPADDLPRHRRGSGQPKVGPRLSNLPGDFEPGVGAGALQGGIDQAEAGEFVQRGIDPAVEGNVGGGRQGQGSGGGQEEAEEKDSSPDVFSKSPCHKKSLP